MKANHLPVLVFLFLSAFAFSGCGTETEHKQTPNSEMNSATPTGIDESDAAMGVGAGNQDEEGGYPANQANLHPDSTKRDSTNVPR